MPDEISGNASVRPFLGVNPVSTASGDRTQPLLIDAPLEDCELGDSATISFYYHLRYGDDVRTAVLDAVARRDLLGGRIAHSSFLVHAPLVERIRTGVVTGISATYIAGSVGEAIARGELAEPVRMLTHGGRARAIEVGELPIDIAYVAARAADLCGNVYGVAGPAACGTLGYALVDVTRCGDYRSSGAMSGLSRLDYGGQGRRTEGFNKEESGGGYP